MKKPESICIFGDSTAWGAWDLEKGGWVNRLWLNVGHRQDEYVEICNLSISGGTSDTILQRFESEAKIRKADALIFQTGGNDASYTKSPGENLVALKDFESNIQEVITRAKKITTNIIFIGFKNCDETKTIPVSWCDYCYSNENIRKYNSKMEEVCKENNVLYLDVFGILNQNDFYDGLHPNESGHLKLYEVVKDFLTKKSWI